MAASVNAIARLLTDIENTTIQYAATIKDQVNIRCMLGFCAYVPFYDCGRPRDYLWFSSVYWNMPFSFNPVRYKL